MISNFGIFPINRDEVYRYLSKLLLLYIKKTALHLTQRSNSDDLICSHKDIRENIGGSLPGNILGTSLLLLDFCNLSSRPYG